MLGSRYLSHLNYFWCLFLLKALIHYVQLVTEHSDGLEEKLSMYWEGVHM